jgi:hypothetical protein
MLPGRPRAAIMTVPDPNIPPGGPSMLQRVRMLLILIALLAIPAAAAEFSATTWDEALSLSRQHDKPILIDFFTEW